MATQDELFASVDALLEETPQLPSPAERARLREEAGITQARLAQALKTTTQTVKNWENGRSEPRPPRLEAYQRLLEGWAARHRRSESDTTLPNAPVPASPAPAGSAPASGASVPGTPAAAPPAPVGDGPPVPSGGSAVPVAATTETEAEPAAAAPASPPPALPSTASAARRPARAPAPAPAPVDGRFPNGPLVVLDGDGSAYGAGGIVLDCPAATVPALVEWTLREAGLGAARLHRNGRDADPLVVLTPAAAGRLGLPERLEDRRGLRLPEDHPVVRQIGRAKWKLTQRGFGPWARIYRPAGGGERQCVQVAVMGWDAFDDRAWPGLSAMEPAEVARVLTVYAARVMTPVGPTATTGLELMTALRPPTRAVRDSGTGGWVSGRNPGSLGTQPVDPSPPEALPEHPVAQGWTGGFLDEEAYQWVRDVDLLTGEEAAMPWALGLDLNTAFLAAAARLTVGLSGPAHVVAPRFDKGVPGAWLVDLSHVDLDPRLPSPFTPSGTRPDGPAWYQTHTVAYAQELGFNVDPAEAYLRRETGAYLDPWHDRLKGAYAATLADLGVTPELNDDAFLAAMEQHKATDPGMAAVLAAVKATVKGGIGKLRQRPQGRHYRDGERWPALERPTWRPDIRAAVISKARVNMHRKLNTMARLTGLYPLAVLSDCVVYPSPSASPVDVLPRSVSGRPQTGTFRLGPGPGLAKLEGARAMTWAVGLMEQGLNPARHIKSDGHDAVMDDGE
ncbi:helix-turn-helix domain-containing protein [Streptomyces sp. NPDC005811]|uniref:telomere-associated protein Tap n=1 Tax=Streptomyces sp. NPDC005811 TaxID=3154565 RepID=UPI0033CFD3E6